MYDQGCWLCQCTELLLDISDLVGDEFPSLYNNVVKYGIRNSQTTGQ